MPPRLRCLIGLVLLQLWAVPLKPQTSAPETVGPSLKAASRLVVVDVVVTDANGSPIRGLRKEDFKVFEDGKPQTISVFEEHTGKLPTPITTPALPPNTFSNAPRTEGPDSLNVVLLDALNTPIPDQAYVHRQVLKYLTNMHAGEPIAIFLLSSRLRLVHGFSSDLSSLLAALNDKKSRSGPQGSPLLRSGGEIHAEEQLLGQMKELAMEVGDPDIQAAMDSLRQFLAESESSQTSVRVRTTLSVLEQLARYLAAFPGRKNVIWFSGAFPLVTFQGNLLDRDHQEEVRKTADALTWARVAVYPVEAGGLVADPLYDASTPPRRDIHNASEATDAQLRQLLGNSAQRTAKQAIMEKLARDTGGRAFYNTNGLNDALAQVVRFGAYYYTLDYVPTNTTMDGQYRRIKVKLAQGQLNLSYRRGYRADDERTESAVTARLTTDDPLRPLMASGLPSFAQIRYLMSVQPSTPQPELTAKRAGDNPQPEGPFTRMDVDLAVSEKAIQWKPMPDGTHRAMLEVTFIAYDRYGNQMNWLARNLDVSLTPERYKEFWDVGLQFHFEFDAPRSAAYLRSGVCDLASGKAGTMEVLLSAPPVVPRAAKSE